MMDRKALDLLITEAVRDIKAKTDADAVLVVAVRQADDILAGAIDDSGLPIDTLIGCITQILGQVRRDSIEKSQEQFAETAPKC